MIIYASSDWHLLDGSKRDDAVCIKQSLMQSVFSVPAQAQIVLLGDIVDIQRANNNINSIINYWGWLLEELAHRRAIWIIGNHDYNLTLRQEQNKLPSGFIFMQHLIIDNLLFCHGNEFDLACGRFRKIGEFAVKLANFIGKISPRLEDWICNVEGKMRGVGRHAKPEKMETLAREYINMFALCDKPHIEYLKGIVMGHTHNASFTCENELSYINTGTPLRGNAFVIIKDGTYYWQTRMPKDVEQ